MARTNRGTFQPGTSGNPAGRPKETDEPNFDGWASALTGMNMSDRDKRMSHEFVGARMTHRQIARLWAKDGIASKAIEAPSDEAFREGYELVFPNEEKFEKLKSDVEERIEELKVDDALELAWQYKRAYGGSAILLGTDDSRPLSAPLDITKAGRLEYLRVFEPAELVPEKFYGELKNVGTPSHFRINNLATNHGALNTSIAPSRATLTNNQNLNHAVIHESRLLVFQGIKTSNVYPSCNEVSPFWGDNVIDRFIDALRDAGVGYQGAGIIAVDGSQPVITIEGLKEHVHKNPKKFLDRMGAIELGRSNARAILLDAKGEKYERQTTNLTGIPDLLDRLSIWCCANIGIPLSVLLGYAPTSLGQPGDVELRLWYNIIRAMQTRRITPPLKTIIRLILRGMRERGIPKRFGVEWMELDRLNEKDTSEARLNQARADEIYSKYGVIKPNELRKSRWSGRYSYETQVDLTEEAPGYVAALPPGVVLGKDGKAVPGGAKTAAIGTAAPAAGAGAAHTVGGYARRNPTKRDGIDDVEFAMEELEYARAKLEAARSSGDTGAIAAFEYIVAYEEQALALARTLNDADGRGTHIAFAGMNICIESPKGSTREWTDTDGTTGSTTMKYDYGYVVGTSGADGDSVDVYLGPSPSSEWVYVVHQRSKASDFTQYDEDKVMLGFDSPNHARDAYLRQYDDERFFGEMTVMSLADFRLKLFTEPGEKVAA